MSLNLNGCVIACKCPSFVNFDEQGRFHSVESKAIQWADGWGVYCVNGISFDEDKFKKFFIEKNYTNEDFQSVTNTEQKAVLIKHLGYEKVISLLKDYTEIDRYKGMSKVTNKPVEYVLFEHSIGEVRIRTVMVEDHSVHKKTFLNVPIQDDTDSTMGAIAWTFSMPKEEYISKMVMES